MNNPLISICIANYNKSVYIKQCLDSILNIETYQNKEIVIVDDCSTDNSVEIINNWIKFNWSKIKIIFKINEKNSWPWYTYNRAIKNSSWEYITFMDSDDFFINASLENKLGKFTKSKNLKVIYWNWDFYENSKFSNSSIHENIYKTFKGNNFNPNKILEIIYCKVPMLSISSALIKKEFLNKIWWFDEKILSNDWILNIKIFKNLQNSSNFEIDLNIAFAYRIYENNISKDFDKILIMLSEVIEKYCTENLKDLWYSNIYFTNSLSNLTIWNYKKAFTSMKKSINSKFEVKKILVFILVMTSTKIIKYIPKRILNKIKSIILKYFQ